VRNIGDGKAFPFATAWGAGDFDLIDVVKALVGGVLDVIDALVGGVLEASGRCSRLRGKIGGGAFS